MVPTSERNPGSAGSASSRTGPRGPASGMHQLGYSVLVPGWFWVRVSPTASTRATPSSNDGVSAVNA